MDLLLWKQEILFVHWKVKDGDFMHIINISQYNWNRTDGVKLISKEVDSSISENLCSELEKFHSNHSIIFKIPVFIEDDIINLEMVDDMYKISAFIVFNGVDEDIDYGYDDELVTRYTQNVSYLYIRNCPFCGKAFKENVVNTSDVSDIYNEEYDRLNKAIKMRKSTQKNILISDIIKRLYTKNWIETI